MGESSKDEQRLARRREGKHIKIPCMAFHKPMGEGTFRYAAKGVYTAGSHKGDACVAKWFKREFRDYTRRYLREDLRAVDKAVEIVDAFQRVQRSGYTIRVSRPEVVSLTGIKCEHGGISSRQLLVEPYLSNWQRWNSNSGYHNSNSTIGKLMQSLSHFSYHYSEGRYLLYDLQGGVSGSVITISDPAIGSKRGGYGMTDLGSRGMTNFFHHHKCNGFCGTRWIKPRGRKEFDAIQSTVMM